MGNGKQEKEIKYIQIAARLLASSFSGIQSSPWQPEIGRGVRVHGGNGKKGEGSWWLWKFVEKDLCLVESCPPVSFFIRELLRISLFSCLSLSELFNDGS